MTSRRAKRKYNTRKQKKKQKGGTKEDVRAFLSNFNTHEYLSNIGPNKPVGTPNQYSITEASEFDKFIKLWEAMKPKDINYLNEQFMKRKGFTLNAYHPKNFGAHKIIFYAEEYLDLLAEAAGKTQEEVLKILSDMGEKSQEEMDIIEVAFGDEYMSKKKLSNSGKALLEKYKLLLSKIAP